MSKFLMDIESYKTRFTGGARQYLFFVFLDMGAPVTNIKSGSQTLEAFKEMASSVLSTFGFGASKDFYPYLVKSTNLPDSTIEEKVIPLQGFNYKIPGDRVFSDWTVTFNIDDKGELLDKLHIWQNSMISIDGGSPFYKGLNSRKQMVFLVDYQGNSFAKYEIFGAWPKSIGQVSMDYTANGIATVDVIFSYLYFKYSKDVPSGLQNLVKQGVNTLLGK